MSDPILSQVSLYDSDENEDFYSAFTPRGVNGESTPEGRDPCVTDPQRLEKTVLLQNVNEVTQQEQDVVPGVLSNPVQGPYPVFLEAPVNQPLVNSSGGNVESLVSVPIHSADASKTGNEELRLIPEEAASTANTSVPGKRKFMWECKEPCDSPEKEKKRKAAIKARTHRVQKKKETADLKLNLEHTVEELTRTKKSLADALRENQILKELLQAAMDGRPIQFCYTVNQETPQN